MRCSGSRYPGLVPDLGSRKVQSGTALGIEPSDIAGKNLAS